MSENLGIKGSEFVTYKGQMQLPPEHTVVEYGFIFSRSSDVLTLDSLGATIVPSNIYYGVTGEFMRSFPVTTFNSIRAYMIYSDVSNAEHVVYSDNYFRSISQIGESGTFVNDFEDIANGGYESKTIYTGDTAWTASDSFTGTDANDRKNGLKSLRIRNGNLTSNSTFSNISLISFAAGAFGGDSGLSIKISVKSSTVDWIDVTDAIMDPSLSTTLKSFSIDLGDSSNFINSTLTLNDNLFIKIEKGSGTSTSRYNIDDLSITSEAYTGPIHEVILSNDGQTISNVQDGTIISNPEQKTGYTFDAWYYDSNYASVYNGIGITQSVNLYAKYNINQYTINFNYNGADGGNSITSLTDNYQSTLDLPIPTKTGYTFVRWESSTGSTEYASPFTVGATTYNMYAKWEPNLYDIEFVTGDPAVSVETISANYQSSVPAPSSPSREGYSFVGWYYEDSYDTLVIFPITMPLEGLTLFAKWDELSGDTFTVTFDSNGGSLISSVLVNSGNSISKPNDPTYSGHYFLGWKLNGEYYNFSSNINSNVTLIAEWTELFTVVISEATQTTYGKDAIPDGELVIGTANNHIKVTNSGLPTIQTYFYSNSSLASIFNNGAGEIRLYGASNNGGGQLNLMINTAYFVSVTVTTSQNAGYSINSQSTVTELVKTTNFTNYSNSLIIKNTSTGQVRVLSITLMYILVNPS